MHRRFITGIAAAALALGLAACGGSETPATPDADTTSASEAATGEQGENAPLAVANTWAKALPDISQKTTTGVFGTIENTTDADVTVVSAENSHSPLTELHETVMKDGAMVMQKVEDGFVVKAGESRELRPGGDHVMVMQMDTPLDTGDEVTVTLTTDTGATIEFDAVAKPFTGADERYAGDDESGTDAPSSSATSH